VLFSLLLSLGRVSAEFYRKHPFRQSQFLVHWSFVALSAPGSFVAPCWSWLRFLIARADSGAALIVAPRSFIAPAARPGPEACPFGLGVVEPVALFRGALALV